uniref:non-specific serine/threonine protein kinase n=1 Tax=Fagus sylvatica TaxID=28930 RepID=A0A2N9FJB3_FAGSY
MASFSLAVAVVRSNNITTDQSALLALKAHITDDPYNFLTSNWSTSTSVCNWIGISCGAKHQRVTALNLTHMGLTGTIPPHVGNLSFLTHLSFRNNSFHGSLPNQLASLRRLEVVSFGMNNFSGELPSWLGFFPKLQVLYAYSNSFSGSIPLSLYSNASSLQIIHLGENMLSGMIPRSLGNCTSLKEIHLDDNYLTGELPLEIGNLQNLMEITLANNSLTGTIPNAIFNISTIEVISLYLNQFSGQLPLSIGHWLPNLKELYLWDNELKGIIPNSISNASKLTQLELGNLSTSLEEFFAFNCNIKGIIPVGIGNLSNMMALHLEDNELAGPIPSTVGGMRNLQGLFLQHNRLQGSIPIDIDLSWNQLSGDIPTSIGGLDSLANLSIAHNKFQGPIPQSFDKLISMVFLDLSHNNFSGVIPKSLMELKYLKYFNVSFNRLQGEIPFGGVIGKFSAQSFMGNEALCGPPQLQVPPCKSSNIGHSKTDAERDMNKLKIQGDLLPLATWRRISYFELELATYGFSESNLVGKGSFGSVYRGTLSDRSSVAVKVFNLNIEGGFKSFEAECDVLCRIRHRNLVRIISSCSSMDFKALVLEFMPKGSLKKWLYSHNYFLDIQQRLNMMIDVASALEYLHHGCPLPVVHCDLKPNNILLNKDMVAHVSDFGISKLLGDEDSMTQTMTLATIGYMAPEYGSQGIISTRGDVYSYGILLMETFTRKSPTDEMFDGEMSLNRWVKESLPHAVIEVVDANLLKRGEDYFTAKLDCISSIHYENGYGLFNRGS